MTATTPMEATVRRALLDGLDLADRATVASVLGLGEAVEGIEDRALVRALAERVEGQARADLCLGRDRRRDPRPADAAGAEVGAPLVSADASLPARLGREGDGVAIESVAEVDTLLLVLRGGTRAQQRAAVRRLADLVSSRERRRAAVEHRRVVERLEGLRHPALAWVRHEALLRLGGGPARQARAEAERRHHLQEQVLEEARQYWEGERDREPVTSMPGDERARLLLWLRETEDDLAFHVAGLVEGADPTIERDERMALLSSCRFAADPRLVPALLAVLDGEGGALVAEAARALASVEDPRVLPALREAFDRAVLDVTRAALAGALGELGDRRGLEEVRTLLDSDEPSRVQAALGALAYLGEAEDVERVVPWLGADDPALRLQAVRTLGHIGDARSLEPLGRLLVDPELPAGLRRAVREAIDAVKARMELRGEETTELPLLGERASMVPTASGAEEVDDQPSWRPRWRARWHFWMGRLAAALGLRARALARYERAARSWPRWVGPRLAAARLLTSEGRYGLALAAFRLALEADRRAVERSERAMEALVQAFLRRAEQLEREGRREVARGLVDELRTLDLARVPGPLRFEVERRAEDLRLWSGEVARGALPRGST